MRKASPLILKKKRQLYHTYISTYINTLIFLSFFLSFFAKIKKSNLHLVRRKTGTNMATKLIFCKETKQRKKNVNGYIHR